MNNDLYQYIYYLEIINGDKKTYLPIRIDFEKLESLGIFAEHLKMDYDRNLKIKVDMHKLRILTAKAKNGELTEDFLDKETIKRLQEAYDSVRAKENELINFLYSIKSNSDIAYLDIMKRLISAYKSKPNNKEITVDISLIASNPESPCERMVRLFKDSKIDCEDAVVYYPIKTNNNPRVKPILYPIRVSDVMAKIKEDLPDTHHYVSVHGRNQFDYMNVRVNTQDFESLLISIQNPEEQTRKLHK